MIINLQVKQFCSYCFLYIFIAIAYMHISYWLLISYKFYEACFVKIMSKLIGYKTFVHDRKYII